MSVTQDEIRQTLLGFLQEEAAVDLPPGVTDTTPLLEGLGLTSVDLVGVVIRIENHYRIRLSQQDLQGLKTLGDALALVEMRLANPLPVTTPPAPVPAEAPPAQAA